MAEQTDQYGVKYTTPDPTPTNSPPPSWSEITIVKPDGTTVPGIWNGQATETKP